MLAAIATGVLYARWSSCSACLPTWSSTAAGSLRLPQLPPFEQERFQRYGTTSDAEAPPGLARRRRHRRRTGHGTRQHGIDNLNRPEPGLAWRAHVADLLATRVNAHGRVPGAADLRMTCHSVKEDFGKQWKDAA